MQDVPDRKRTRSGKNLQLVRPRIVEIAEDDMPRAHSLACSRQIVPLD